MYCYYIIIISIVVFNIFNIIRYTPDTNQTQTKLKTHQ